jgi:hypothetical protein
MSKVKEQKLPKWFDGELYKKGAWVQNRFSGEEYKLNAIELSMYDFVMGSVIMSEMGHTDVVPNLRRGLDWFRTHNSRAYMVLLD